MRKWRKTHPLTDEQKRRSNARCTANAYQKRGKLVPEPCLICGDPNTQKHPVDYNKPLEVVWLCRDCHSEVHHSI